MMRYVSLMSLFGVPSDPLFGALSDPLFGAPSEPPTILEPREERSAFSTSNCQIQSPNLSQKNQTAY